MRLRAKILLVLSLTIVLMAGVLYTIASRVMLSGFVRIEHLDTQRNVERVVHAFEEMMGNLETKSADWACWDDTYQFIEDGNAAFQKSNLTDSVLGDLKLDLMVFRHNSGRIVFSMARDPEDDKPGPIPSGLGPHLAPGSPLLEHADLTSAVSGLVVLPEGPLVVVSRPITTSDKKSPARGTLIFGRFLGNNEVQALGKTTRLAFGIHRLDGNLTPGRRAVLRHLDTTHPILVEPLDGDTVAGYTLLKDLNHSPALLLEVLVPRQIYNQGLASVRYVTRAVTLVGVIFGLLSLWLLERLALSRLEQLRSQVNTIGAKHDSSARVSLPGRDEISSLAHNINTMLAALAESEKTTREVLLRDAEERKRAAQAIQSRDRLLEGVAKATGALLTDRAFHPAVQHALELLGQTMGADRAYLFQRHVDPSTAADLMSQRYEWCAPGIAPQMDNPDLQNIPCVSFARWWDAMRAGRPIRGPITQFPDDERRILDPQDIQSLLVVPIMVRGKPWGFVGFDDCHAARPWSDPEVAILSTMASSLAGAIVRDETETELREHREHLEQLVEERSRSLLDAERQLLRNEKLASVGQLAAGVAHEINTPIQYVGDNLRALSGSLDDLIALVRRYHALVPLVKSGATTAEAIAAIETAQQECDLDYILEDTPQAIAQSLEGVGRVAHIVRAMKAFSHMDRGASSVVDINHSLESTLTIARNEYKYVADLVTDFGELPQVECYAGELNQVFLNMVVNAAHAIADTGQRGTITVRTRSRGDHVEIAIADTGTGIPEEIREKIFDPFFTTKEVGKGTGQGLSIAHQIVVQKHHGSITFETQMGKGTTFTIQIPVSMTHEATTPSGAST